MNRIAPLFFACTICLPSMAAEQTRGASPRENKERQAKLRTTQTDDSAAQADMAQLFNEGEHIVTEKKEFDRRFDAHLNLERQLDEEHDEYRRLQKESEKHRDDFNARCNRQFHIPTDEAEYARCQQEFEHNKQPLILAGSICRYIAAIVSQHSRNMKTSRLTLLVNPRMNAATAILLR